MENQSTNNIPKVLNARQTGTKQDGAVYIGRPGPWGNPFTIGKDGDRDDVVAKYRAWIEENPEIAKKAAKDLAGKNLICWCDPESCHGHVLSEIANPDLAKAGLLPHQQNTKTRNAGARAQTASTSQREVFQGDLFGDAAPIAMKPSRTDQQKSTENVTTVAALQAKNAVMGFQGENRFLSNFMKADIVLDGITYPTVEHAYQAAKTTSVSARTMIASDSNPGAAKRAGRRLDVRPDWEEIKQGVMEGLVAQKYSQEPWRSKLMALGDRPIVELNTWGDKTWGMVERNGVVEGKNMMGIITEKVRDDLIKGNLKAGPVTTLDGSETRNGAAAMPLPLKESNMKWTPGKDMLKGDHDCIINTVNCHGVMGKGLAKTMADRFPGIMDPYKKVCHEGRLKPGMVLPVRVDRASGKRDKDGDLWIFNVATKDHWKDPSRMEWVNRALEVLPVAMEKRGIKNPGIPMMGSGLGGLDWKMVAQEVRKAFNGIEGLNVTVYGEEPQRLSEMKGEMRGEMRKSGQEKRTTIGAAGGEKFYAGIGARDTPPDVLDLMKETGAIMAKSGWTLRSGAAAGADSAFESGADTVKGSKEIFIPWNGFQGRGDNEDGVSVLKGENLEGAENLAAKYHPAWDKLTRGQRALMARNSAQILGGKLDRPADVVIAWTQNGDVKGGTGQALRMAAGLGIPSINLGEERFKGLSAAEIALEAGRAANSVKRTSEKASTGYRSENVSNRQARSGAARASIPGQSPPNGKTGFEISEQKTEQPEVKKPETKTAGTKAKDMWSVDLDL